MKDIRPALRAFLLADPDVVDWVGARVYPMVIPQGVQNSCIVYTRVSGRSGHHMQGRDGLAMTRMQIDAYGVGQDDAAELADLVKDRLDGYKGAWGDVTVQGVFFQDEREDYNDTVSLYRMSRDYFIDFVEV